MFKRVMRSAAALLCAAAMLLGGGCVEAAIYSFEAERDLSIAFTNDDEFYFYGDGTFLGAAGPEPVKLEEPAVVIDIAITDTTAVLLAKDGLYAAGTIADLPFGDASTLESDGIVRFVYDELDAALDDAARYVPEDLSDAQQIAAGSDYVLVRKLDGRVYAWGSNDVGQLAAAEDVLSSNVPVRVGELEGVSLVAAGADGLCAALDMNGHVWAWGNAVEGVVMLPMEQVVHVVCGRGFLAALDVNADVWFWEPSRPEEPAIVGGLPDVFSLVAGDRFLAAKDGEGNVWTWGENDEGQLGRVTESNTDWTPAKVEGIEGIVSISAGRAHVMAMTQNLAIYLWGSNAQGQLGRNGEGGPTPTEGPLIRMNLSRA